MASLNMLNFLSLLVVILPRVAKSKEAIINAAPQKNVIDTTTMPPWTTTKGPSKTTSCPPVCETWRIKVRSVCPSYHEFERELTNCTTILLANPINECTYYICAPMMTLSFCQFQIGPVLKHCPEGTVFVPEKHRCDYKRDANGRVICLLSCPTTKRPMHCNGTIGEPDEDVDLCTTGRLQSPIDLDFKSAIKVKTPPLKWFGHSDSRPDGFDIRNTGETAELRYRGDKQPSIEGGGFNGTYELTQVHFHWNQNLTGSEHDINGILYALEAHFVHFNKKYGNFTNALQYQDGLVVTGFLFRETAETNTNFDGLISGLKNIRKAGQSTQLGPNALAWLKPYLAPNNFFIYKLQEFLKLEDEDGDRIVENSRVIQNLNDRVLYFST